MQFGQSRLNSRGALIAVIKIEIDADKTDRIFLHQNDEDYRLAEEFVDKHNLDPALAQHIYERIAFSRSSVEVKQVKQIVTPQPYRHTQNRVQNSQQYKEITPYENLISHREEQPSFEQSFGHLKRSNNQPIKNPSLFQTNEETYSKQKYPIQVRQEEFMDAPVKRLFQDEKEFRLYTSSEEEVPTKLFPSEVKLPQKKKLQSPPPKSNYTRSYGTAKEQKVPSKAQQLPQKTGQTVAQFLRTSKSLPKFKSIERVSSKPDEPAMPRQVNSAKKSDYDKPLHVKILRKEEIQSLNNTLKKSMSKQQISRINKDVTSRLYNEGEIKKNYLNIIKEKVRKEKEKEKLEDAELTHRPEINKISQAIAEGRRRNDVPIENYLIEEGKKAEVKRQEVANRKYLEQIENCTFQPQLNLISQKLAAEKSKFDSRMSENKFKKCKYKDQNLFRPSLSKVTYELMKDKGNFEARQRQFLEQKNLRMVEKVKQKRTNEKIDVLTGQQLFKPKIHDLGVRESKGANIGDYLYQLGKQQNCENQDPSHQPKINDSSVNMVKQMQFRRISWLFSQLDSDQDGLISANKININVIPKELLRIIKPILYQLQEMNEELNLMQFNNSVEVLHKQLTTYERNILYHFKPQKVT